MEATERFLQYIGIWTTSERDSGQEPSSLRQFDLAHQLVFELKEMGLERVEVDNHCLVYGFLPATPGLERAPCLGLLAHLDTYPDCSGYHVRPQILPDYDGGEVIPGDSGLRLTVSDFPHLPSLAGQTLITSSGDTLLGADDKAGIAEILTALERVIAGGRPHGPVSVAFMPDEEIGIGTAHLDLKRLGAQYAFTVDGWEVGEIVTETFNAVLAEVETRGVNIHTGRAKGIMINAQLVALEFADMLPAEEIPARTEGYEGFYHLRKMSGTVEEARLWYNLRDFSREGIQKRMETMEEAAGELNRRYGPGTVRVRFREEYRNLNEVISRHPEMIEKACAACRKAGVEPKVTCTRGGSDGARVSFAGVPCPNLGVGGWAYHSPQEHITAEAIERVSRILEELIVLYGEAEDGT